MRDLHQDSIPDTITITSKINLLPIARIDGNSEQYASIGERVSFSGIKRIDPEGDGLTYQWALAVAENSSTTLEYNNQATTSFPLM